jgi:peptide deformylase
MDTIVQVGDGVLRKKALEVPVTDITTPKIKKIIKQMKESLDKEPDGAALAAPQIGVSLRIFILAEKVFGSESEHEASNNDPHHVYINPTIIKRSNKKDVMDEGCLSVRGKYGNVKRSRNVTIEAYDEHGEKFVRGAGGLLAQAFQHECDHLEGRLFFDNAIEIWDVEVTQDKEDNSKHEDK